MVRNVKTVLFAALLTVVTVSAQTSSPTPPAAAQVAYSESASYSPRTFPAKDKKKAAERGAKMTAGQTTAITLSTLTIPVAVYANNVNAKDPLKPGDFRVLVDDKEVEIVSVEQRTEPLNVILLIDVSPSTMMSVDVKKLSNRIVDRLAASDRTLVAGLYSKLDIHCELTSDRTVIKKAIDRLEQGDGTSLYQAIQEIFDNKLTSVSGPAMVIVATDGVDTTSTRSDFQTSLLAAERSTIPVFPIYFDTRTQLKTTTGAPTRLPPELEMALRSRGIVVDPRGILSTKDMVASYALGRDYLSDLILLSGGRPVRGNELLSGQMGSLDNLTGEMKERYYVTFRLPTGGRPGDRHRIKVRVNRPSLTILAKGGYIDQ